MRGTRSLRGTVVFAAAAALLMTALAPGCVSLGGASVRDQERDVLGVPLRIKLRDPDSERAEHASSLAFAQAKRIGKLMLAKRRTSNFGVLNTIADDHWIDVPEETVTVVERVLRIAEITNGAYTPTRNILLDTWGVSTDQARVPSDDEIAQAVFRASWKRLELDKRNGRIKRKGTRTVIDLEDVAIAAMVEIAVLTLKNQGVPAAHVQSGGISSVFTEPDGQPWPLQVMSVDEAGRPRVLAELDIREGGFATVYPKKISIAEDGTRIHECIHPRSGRPINDVNAAAVRAEHATVAAGLASAAFVMGDRATLTLIKHPEISWLVDTHDHGRTHTPDLEPRWLVEEQRSAAER